jgi:benzil reductase ((S)-benzoin forming)
MPRMRTLLIVTGGSTGLGRALIATAPSGTHRVDVSRSGPPPEADHHRTIDLADPTGWAACTAAIDELVAAEPWDRITVIHNAGTLQPIGFAGEVDRDEYTASVLLGSAAGQVLGGHVLAAAGGVADRVELVMISSGAARSVYPGWSAYGAGKAALDQWVRTVGAEQQQRADEQGRAAVRVLAIAPGIVATDMQAMVRSTDARAFPQVERFRRMRDDRQLTAPEVAANGIWDVLDDPSVATGSVVDLRDRSVSEAGS